MQALYSLPASDFHDITSGYNGLFAGPGYNEVTGLGSPIANLLVPDLASYGLPTQLAITAQPHASVTAGQWLRAHGRRRGLASSNVVTRL